MKPENKEGNIKKKVTGTDSSGVGYIAVRIITEASVYMSDIKSFSIPHKKSTKKVRTDLNNFNKCTIRLIIHECQCIEGERPTFRVI